MKIRLALLLGGAVALFGQPARAHHSFAMFDYQKELTVEGVVREFQWTNPHCWIRLVVTDNAGKQVEWNIEGQSPNALVRSGWSRDSIKTGDKATVVIHPLKDGSPGGSVVRAIVNGQPLSGPGPGERPAGAPP